MRLNEQKERLCWSALFSAENYSFRSSFYCKTLGAGVSHAKSLRGWSGSMGCRMLEGRWEGERRRATASSCSWSCSWSCMSCLLLLWLLLQPRSCLLCRRLISWCLSEAAMPPVPLPWWLSVSLGCAITLGAAGRAAPSPLPSMCSGWRRNLQSRGCECCEGCCCSSAAGWMSLKAREGEENPQKSFGKIFIKQYLLWELLSVRWKRIFLSFLQLFWAASLITDLFWRLTRWEPAL